MARPPDRARQQGRPRHTLTLTDDGREELRRRLREADDVDISDENRWFTVLAFLRHLQAPAEQADVLRRRLTFLQGRAVSSTTTAPGASAPSALRPSTTRSDEAFSRSPVRRARRN